MSGNIKTTLPGIHSNYRVHRLLYFESFKYVGNAIARKKTIRGWLRDKEVALIRSANPTGEDLSQGWFDVIFLKVDENTSEKQVLRFAQDDKL